MNKYTITDKDFRFFIAEWLNNEHENYTLYVKGIKLFKTYLEERESEPVTEVGGDGSNE